MNALPLRPALALAALLTLTVACGGSQRPGDDLPAPHPDLKGAAAAMTDSPLMATTSAQGLKAMDNRLLEIISHLPGIPDGFSPMAQFAREVDSALEASLPLLDQLAPTRPIVVALRSNPLMERSQEVVYGVLPNVLGPAEPAATRLTILLPTPDPAKLESALAAWVSQTGGKSLIPTPDEAKAVVGDRRLMGGGDLLLVVGRRSDYLVIDAVYADANADALKVITTALQAPDAPPRGRTPAWGQFLSGQSHAALYADLSRWPAFLTWLAVTQANDALRHATPDSRAMMLAFSWSSIFSSAIAMDPESRAVHDATIGIRAEPIIDVTLTETLTPKAAAAYDAARKAAGPTYGPATGALLEVQLGYSPRALLDAFGHPTWLDPGAPLHQAFEILQEGGPALLPYIASGPSWMALSGQLSALPDSASFVVSQLRPPAQGEPAAIDLAIVATGPKGSDPPRFAPAEIFFGAIGAGGFTRVDLDTHTRFQMAVQKPIDALIDFTQPQPRLADNLRARLDVTRLSGVFQVIQQQRVDEELLLLRQFSTIELVTASNGNALTSTLRLTPLSASAKDPLQIEPIPGAAAPRPPKNLDCLRKSLAFQRDLFKALASAPSADRGGYLVQSVDQLTGELTCADGDPSTRAIADRAITSWRLNVAQVLALQDEIDSAYPLAQRACKDGDADACALAKRLEPAWPADSLNLPTTPWIQATRPGPSEPLAIIAISREGVYIDDQRVGDADMSAADIKRALPPRKADPGGTNRAPVQVLADRSTPTQRLAQLTAALSDTWWPVQLTLRSHQGRRDAFTPAPPQPTGGVWVTASPTTITLRSSGADGAVKTDTVPFGQHFALAQRLAILKATASDGLVFHLHAEPGVSWGDLAPIVSTLRLPADASFTNAGSLEEVVQNSATLRAPSMFPVILLDAPTTPRWTSAVPGGVETGAPVVRGSLDREVIQRTIRGSNERITYCYERGLIRDPSLGGKLTMTWTVQTNGAVAAVTTKGNELNDVQVERCVADVIRKMTFPKPRGGGVVIITYPFIFKKG